MNKDDHKINAVLLWHADSLKIQNTTSIPVDSATSDIWSQLPIYSRFCIHAYTNRKVLNYYSL